MGCRAHPSPLLGSIGGGEAIAGRGRAVADLVVLVLLVEMLE
jgi:hypothetical protein